ncbi:MAG: shikimate dehydrogenase [Sphingobium sp.]|nr:shikimate dehydrogenase [Sphingobium sp.]
MIRSGLIGRSILSSKSPWLHEQEARAQGLALTYELFDFTDRHLDDDALDGFVKDRAREGFAGLNITYPFKQRVIPVLDDLSRNAAMVGAVNTIAMRDGRLIGHNTDMEGFRDSFAAGLPDVAMNRALLLGAGGAGAAVASALLLLGVKCLDVADADFGRAEALAARLNALVGSDRVRAFDLKDLSTDMVDGIVNATPMGMIAQPGLPIAPDLIHARHWVADIVYFPVETELLRTARAKGCATLDGTGMVIAQAALAFEIITGHAADQQRMRRSFASGQS